MFDVLNEILVSKVSYYIFGFRWGLWFCGSLLLLSFLLFLLKYFWPYCAGQEKIEKLIPGKMGNKGGVAIRFELYQTSLCFVNSHFAAHLSQYKKRNQNFRDISKKMIFKEIRPNKRIIDHDMIYWLGKSHFKVF